MIPRNRFITIIALLTLAALIGGCAGPAQLLRSEQQRIAVRTFVVTGASSGFGRGVAIKLARYGSNVVLTARRKDVLEDVAAEVRTAGGTPLVVPTDVSQSRDIDPLARAALERFGQIDVWINNARVGAIGRLEEIPL